MSATSGSSASPGIVGAEGSDALHGADRPVAGDAEVEGRAPWGREWGAQETSDERWSWRWGWTSRDDGWGWDSGRGDDRARGSTRDYNPSSEYKNPYKTWRTMLKMWVRNTGVPLHRQGFKLLQVVQKEERLKLAVEHVGEDLMCRSDGVGMLLAELYKVHRHKHGRH